MDIHTKAIELAHKLADSLFEYHQDKPVFFYSKEIKIIEDWILSVIEESVQHGETERL